MGSQEKKPEVVPGIIVIAYERKEANFFLGQFRDVKGKKVFQSECRFIKINEESADEKPTRVAQLPIKFSMLEEKYPRRENEEKRRMPFDLPIQKFNKWARAYAINRKEEIETQVLESTFTDMEELEGLLE